MAETKNPTTNKSKIVARSEATKQPRKAGSTVTASVAKQSQKKQSKKPVINRETHNIDATGQVLGRLATQIAMILRGKNKATFLPHIDGGDFVVIKNAAKIKITGQKLSQKVYYHHSGYPGGLKRKKMGDVFDKNPAEIIQRTVWNMLPKNKLRNAMFKRLKISN